MWDRLPAKARSILSSADIEDIFGVQPWTGPAMLEIRGTRPFEVMTKLTSPSGLVSNINCARYDRVHNVLGVDDSDNSYLRLVNTGSQTLQNIRGTLFRRNGQSVGGFINNNTETLIEELGPRSSTWLRRDELIETSTASLLIHCYPAACSHYSQAAETGPELIQCRDHELPMLSLG